MAKTQVADVIVPEIFENYVIERTAEMPKFAQSGIIVREPEIDALAAGGGRTVNMPFWQDLTGDREIIGDATTFTPAKIGADKDIAAVHNDGKSWSTTLLAKLLAGSDPMSAIGDLVAAYWGRQDQAMLVASVNGLYAALDAEVGDPNILKIASESIAGTSPTTQLNGTTFVDATVVLGDAADRLTAVGMHSATEGFLRQNDLIDFIPDSEGKGQIPTFQGRRVVVSDGLPTRAGTTDGTVYTTVLFGEGAFRKGAAALDQTPLEGGFGTEGVEFSRVSLGHDSILINRRRHILHPGGIAWQSASVAGESPTNAELALAANWSRVYESKNVRMVIVTHNNDQ